MEGYNPEYPPGYLEARETYLFTAPDSVAGIWDELRYWRGYENGLPELKMFSNPEDHKRVLEIFAKRVEAFKARILQAVLERDSAYLRKLLKAIKLDRRPQLEMPGIRAALAAFEELFVEEKLESKDEWPSKQEIQRRAEEILREEGRACPGVRQWPRIFQKAGLAELLSVTLGRARKPKKN
jgi:hypothetical protein